MAFAVTFALQAQWVNDPATNTFIANCPEYGTEVYLATDLSTRDTYVQWTSGGSNGYAPSLQRLSFDGTPQWGENGIRITGHNFYSSNEGFAMAVTTDKAVVSCFATADDVTAAVKIKSDGTFAWGEQGVILFDGNAFSRTELVAGNNGGVWALGFDYHQHYLQYINADGTLNPVITVTNDGYDVCYGKITVGNDNNVFLTYERLPSNHSLYTDKEIFLVGYAVDGTQIAPVTQLMTTQNFVIAYIHYVVPDGMGGAYVYIWHAGNGSNFNTYVFHYDANGSSTIDNLNGIAVHPQDPSNNYLDAYATVDPVSHDLLVAYIKENSSYQNDSRIFVNRITTTGERVWDEGILAVDYEGLPYGMVRIDAFEDGSGFSLTYEKAAGQNEYSSTVEALGMDMEGSILWNKTISSTFYSRSMCKNSAGFHLGQNIIAWVNSDNGGLYGQNITPNGNMGPMPQGCLGPKNFQGEYVYDDETQTYGVLLTWDEPAEEVEYYRLYRTDIETEEETVIEFAGGVTSYFDAAEIGQYKYQLRALYAYLDCGFSEPATTPEGYDYVLVEVTGIEENESDEIVTVTRIFNASGQAISNKSLEELSNGLYILQGLNHNGNLVTRKMVINH